MGAAAQMPVRTALRALLAALAISALAALFAAPASGREGSAEEVGASTHRDDLSATIRRTSRGIPHVLADDYAGLGYGYGYALAEDNICVLADSYTTVRARRSKFFGPDESYVFRGNGSTVNNLNSDFFFQRIIDRETVEKLLDQEPPDGPRPEILEAVRGYVAGYNRYLKKTGVDGISDPACRGESWVKPIDEIDAYRRFYQLALLASSGVAIDGIGSAQPPTPPANGGPPFDPEDLDPRDFPFPLEGAGSNAYGLGSDATTNGRGALLGNPHFPWDGSERFYQAQLTIPGEIDVSGASLLGVPVVLIGHTERLAWSHTVSTGYRFTPFELKLVPGSPTTYLVDGQPREMAEDDVEVPVGGGERRSRTLYSTEYGPMFTSLLGQDLFPWTPVQGYAMGDANAANFRYLNHFFETNQAQSVGDLDRVLKRNQGIPWVNTIGADANGRAYYADISVVPHVTDEKAERCNTALGRVTFELLRLPVLDGSQSSCNWGEDPDAIQRGTFGPGNLPSLFRRDYVTNSNDSYWLSNPDEPLTGFNRIIGDEETQRSLRTRLGLVMVRDRLEGSDGKRFGLKRIQRTVFNNRQYAGELFRDELVEMCEQNPVIATQSGPVNVSEACPILADWDLRDDLDSDGAVLFRQFVDRVLGLPGGAPGQNPAIYDEPFDPNDPVDTPRGLNTENPDVRRALGEAVQELRDSGIPLDAPLRGYQYEKRGSEEIPIHGGPGTLGVFNAINVSFSDGKGYPNVPHGSSFVMATRFTDNCPKSRSILTYSQSTNPNSPHFADQTEMYSDKRWVDMLFCRKEIESAPGLEVNRLR